MYGECGKGQSLGLKADPFVETPFIPILLKKINLETENICQSIINSKLYDDLFDHLYINNFLSENFYNMLLKFLPKKGQYTQINKTKLVSVDYPDERYIYN